MSTLTPPQTIARPASHRGRIPAPAVAPPSQQLQRHALIALPAREEWVGSARHFASCVVANWRLSADDRDSAVLVVGELAANAARHGYSDMTLQLTLDPGVLRITIDDHGGPGLHPQPPAGHDPDEHGRGMRIVNLLATRVETWQRSGGRRVLACLSVEHARS